MNSASLDFYKKEWFSIPRLEKSVVRRIAKEKEVSVEGLRMFQELLDDEHTLGMTNYKERERVRG
jgi:hypothetical protein